MTTTTSPLPAPAPRIERHVLRVATVVILGAIMSVLDTTIVNVALHDLSLDLHASLGGIQWVITGYLLSLAAVIPVTGWAVRRYSARRLYLIAPVVFTVGQRRADVPGAGVRPHARRTAAAERRLGVDLHDQRSDRRHRPRPRAQAPSP